MEYKIIYKIKSFFNRLKFKIKHPKVNLEELKKLTYFQTLIEDINKTDLSFIEYLEDSFNA